MGAARSVESLARAAWLVTVLAAPLLLCGCPKPACEHDTDCDPLQLCDGGACVPLDLSAAIAGTCGGNADCSFGEVCLDGRCLEPSGPASCRFEQDLLCAGEGKLCGVAPDAACPDSAPCAAPLACVVPLEGGLKGLTRCTADTDCRSGRCSEGSCLRICVEDSHCPVGFGCADGELAGGLGVRRCTGIALDGTPDPAQTICRGERDCPADRLCRFFDLPGDATCQSTVGTGRDDRATPVCVPRPPTAYRELRDYCTAGSECAGGLCSALCERDGDYADVCGYCHCLQPCADNDDCPALTSCTSFLFRVFGDGEEAKFCAMSDPGCVDDRDCCPRLDPDGLCLGGWSPLRQYCTLSDVAGKPAQLCLDPVGKLPGEGCTEAQECATHLCEPRLSDGTLFCTVPCSTGFDRCHFTEASLVCSSPVNATIPGLMLCR